MCAAKFISIQFNFNKSSFKVIMPTLQFRGGRGGGPRDRGFEGPREPGPPGVSGPAPPPILPGPAASRPRLPAPAPAPRLQVNSVTPGNQ